MLVIVAVWAFLPGDRARRARRARRHRQAELANSVDRALRAFADPRCDRVNLLTGGRIGEPDLPIIAAMLGRRSRSTYGSASGATGPW